MRAIFIIAAVTFSLTAQANTLATIYEFQGNADGGDPMANIALDRAGNIFGATRIGGVNGTIYELSPPLPGQTVWTHKVLWDLPDEKQDGASPYGGVIMDRHGDLFGTALLGGTNNCGTVFEILRAADGWKPKTLYVFDGSKDACGPSATLTMDSSGALYGNTLHGGTKKHGAVFKLTPPVAGSKQWSEEVIWSMTDGADGNTPSTQMTLDSAGNLYGSSSAGGSGGGGSIWQLAPPVSGQTSWSLNVLWQPSEAACTEPSRGPPVVTAGAVLFDTCRAGGANGAGVVFQLTPSASPGGAWVSAAIARFKPSTGGPSGGVVMTKQGNLIGTTAGGILFELKPPASGQTLWPHPTLWDFTGGSGGADPELPPVLGKQNVIYGTTASGGTGSGTVWTLTRGK